VIRRWTLEKNNARMQPSILRAPLGTFNGTHGRPAKRGRTGKSNAAIADYTQSGCLGCRGGRDD
jgi:hypothetical protein